MCKSTPDWKKRLPKLLATVLIGGVLPTSPPVLSQTQPAEISATTGKTPLQCTAPETVGATVINQVTYRYQMPRGPRGRFSRPSELFITGTSSKVKSETSKQGTLNLVSQGIKDGEGQLVFGLGAMTDALEDELVTLGFTSEEASNASIKAVMSFANSSTDTTADQVITAAKTAIEEAIPNKAAVLNGENSQADQVMALVFTGLAQQGLESIGIAEADATTAQNTAAGLIPTDLSSTTFTDIRQQAFDEALNAIPEQQQLLIQAKDSLEQDLVNIQSGQGSRVQSGDIVSFRYALLNTGDAAIEIQTPQASVIAQSGLVGSASIGNVTVEGLEETPETLKIEPGQEVVLNVQVALNAAAEDNDQQTIALGFSSNCGQDNTSQETAQQTIATIAPTPDPRLELIDPFGEIRGCNNELLDDYTGFSVGLFEPDPNDPTGFLSAVELTTTEVPDDPNNTIPEGIEPNTTNANPFFLNNDDNENRGRYSFLFDRDRGQLEQGRSYILVVNPPDNSNFLQRRIRLTINNVDEAQGIVSYTATSLDGLPITTDANPTEVQGEFLIRNAKREGLVLGLLNVDTGICDLESIRITKSADRATAEPGDTIIYRLSLRNLARSAVVDIVVTDDLPLGFTLVEDSVRGELQQESMEIETTRDGARITFRVAEPIPEGGVLNIAYGVQVTPDGIRGDGENSAIVAAERDDNGWDIKDGPVVHRVRIDPGIISDCGTLLGRVFVDKNFDGHQQPGEPGVPNAVIFMENGNRITTDANGLFSVKNVLPGYHTGALDLTSLPGYTLAPNTHFNEGNSQSRLVRLEPGGMARMNFAVTPTFNEEDQQ
ncbi:MULTISPECIES: DUF11 domain-containing protein [Moorena]|uniref:DUF11 domain-containing protein n=1 Tax=Moorena producens 3L TaxID=489825 RepID=F4XQ44_9CYAN|nr:MULTISPECIES: DUF11 domain-containing protein [Moorena]EGJ33273.1 hypothetical protein LYNGBM3L_37790 [Moorena producens 3L]